MNILVTGASGFMGRNFLSRVPRDWRILAVYRHDESFPGFVAGLDRPNIQTVACDLADPGQVVALFECYGAQWPYCLFLAARVDIPWSVREPKADLDTNTGSLLNVLQALRAERMIYFSSGAVYDGMEGEATPDALLSPTLPYAISKLASERYVEFFQKRRGSIGNFLNVRFFGAYGPYEAPHKIYTRLIRSFALEGKRQYQLYGGGQNLIDAMYVDDAIDAILRMIEGPHWNRTINLAGGNPLPVETLAQQVAAALGLDDAIITKEGVAHEANRFWGSTAEMRDLFGFTPPTSLAGGIRRFRDFLTAHR